MDLQERLRAPDGYHLLQRSLQELRRCGAAASLANLELWAHATAEPQGEIAQELTRFVAAGGPFTDEALAALSGRLIAPREAPGNLRDAGQHLSRQIDHTTRAISEAQRSQATYGRVLAIAGAAFDPSRAVAAPALGPLVGTLAEATQRVRNDSSALEATLAAAAREVRELQQSIDAQPRGDAVTDAPVPATERRAFDDALLHLQESLHLVRQEARIDALTTLANRKAFDERLTETLALAQADKRPLALALIDIDHFKKFNDTWGHQTGDEVIRYVGTVLAPLGAEPRLAARYGGEEFALILPGVTGRSAVEMLEKVRKTISTRRLKRRSDGADIGAVTVSAGLANYRAGDTEASLIERADKALYSAKHAGRDRVGEGDRRESAWL